MSIVIDPDFGEVSRFPAPVRWVGTKVGRSGGEGALLEWWEGSELTKVRRRLAPDVRAPAEARAFVASQCHGLSAEAMDVVRLLTTEIVGNAMWHAAPGPLWLDVEAEPDHVAVGVTDAGGGEVRLAPDNHWPETGHGLRLVDALSARWGVEPAAEPPGKRVWFEMAWQDAREVAVPRPRRWEERRHAHHPPAPADEQHV